MCKVYLLDIEHLIFNSDLSDIDSCRAKYINSISNKDRKKQSYFVWKLLEYALKVEGIKDFSFVNNNGKWQLTNEKVKFSLSHSFNMVCVAVDNSYVGVDVEKMGDKILLLEKRYKFSNDNEDKINYLARRFTEEEAIFKANNKGNVISFIVNDNKEKKYSLSVCTDGDVELIKINSL